MLARLFVFFGSLVVLALLTALIGPYFINWTSYRADFERQASAILGRDVSVDGEAKARLLPFPSVTFTDVTVRDPAGEAVAMTIDEFSMDAELAPFLSGNVLIFDMRLVRPRATINIDRDGKVDWAMRPHMPFDPRNIKLERVTVSDGEVQLRSANGADRRMTDIEATISARSLAGPWRADGTLQFDGEPVAVSGSTGIADAEGLRLKLRAEPVNFPVQAEFEGLTTSAGGMLAYKGEFRAFERLAAPKGDRAGGSAQSRPVGNRVNGRFDLTDSRLAVEEFRFEAGSVEDPYVANGTATVEFGEAARFTVNATGAQIRLDEENAAQSASETTMAQRISAVENLLGRLPLPAMPGAVDIRLPAIIAGDTTIRDVTVTAKTAANGWAVDRLTASLPGRTTLEASGALALRPKLGFGGRLLVAVGQPSGFSNWLANDIDAPVRRLSQAGFEANVELAPDRQVLDGLELVLGNASFKGRLERLQSAGAKSRLLVDMTGGAVRGDEASALASFFFDGNWQNRFSDHTIDLKLKAGPVGDAPYSADGVDLALRMDGETVEIDKFGLSGLAGASVAATGAVERAGASPVVQIDASVISDDLVPLADLLSRSEHGGLAKWLADAAQSHPDLLKDARLDTVVDISGAGPERIMQATVKGEAGGTAIDATLSAQGEALPVSVASLDLKANLKADDGSVFLALAGAPVLPLGMIGGAEAQISLKGVPQAGLQSVISLKSDDGSAGFDGTLQTLAEGLGIRGALNVQTDDVEPWLMTAGFALPGMGTGMDVKLAADLDYADGLMILGAMSGDIAGHAVSGDLNIEVRDGLPAVTGTLVADEIDMGQAAEIVLGPEAFTQGEGMWPSTPFQPRMNAPFRANVDISAARLLFGDLAAQDAVLSFRIDDEGLKVPELSARFGEGTLTGLFDLVNSDATGLLSGQFRLAGARLETVLPQLGVDASAVSAIADASASFTASGKTVSAMVASLTGSGSASLDGLEVEGFNPAGLKEIVAAADEIGRDVDAARTAAFAPAIIRQGKVTGGRLDLAFNIAEGALRVPPLRIERADSVLTGGMKLDLNRYEIEGSGSFTYKAGDAGLVGSEPAVTLALSGPLGAPDLAVDTAPLGQFLTQRALEIEQARVEAMQAGLLEKQRLRREANYFATLELERKRAAEEAARLKAEEEARLKAEEEARLKAEEEARVKAEEDARLKAEEEARLKAEEEARVKAEEEARIKAEEEARRAVVPEPETPVELPQTVVPPVEVQPVPQVAPTPEPKPEPEPAAPVQPQTAPVPQDRPAAPPSGDFPPPPTPSNITDFLRSLQNL